MDEGHAWPLYRWRQFVLWAYCMDTRRTVWLRRVYRFQHISPFGYLKPWYQEAI